MYNSLIYCIRQYFNQWLCNKGTIIIRYTGQVVQKCTGGYLKTKIKYRMLKLLRSSTTCKIEERVKTFCKKIFSNPECIKFKYLNSLFGLCKPPLESGAPKLLFSEVMNRFYCLLTKYTTHLGCYSDTGFHIGMDCNFVCLWLRHNWRSQVIELSLSALISWFMKSVIGFLNNSNLHSIIYISIIIYLHWF